MARKQTLKGGGEPVLVVEEASLYMHSLASTQFLASQLEASESSAVELVAKGLVSALGRVSSALAKTGFNVDHLLNTNKNGDDENNGNGTLYLESSSSNQQDSSSNASVWRTSAQRKGDRTVVEKLTLVSEKFARPARETASIPAYNYSIIRPYLFHQSPSFDTIDHSCIF